MCVVPPEARKAETPPDDRNAKIIDYFVVMPLAHASPSFVDPPVFEESGRL